MVIKKVLGQLRIANLMALEYSLPTYQDLVHTVSINLLLSPDLRR